MIEEEVWYKCTDGKTFKDKGDAEAYQRGLETKAISEAEIRKLVYKHLYEFIQQHNIGDAHSEDVLEFMVSNKKEILLLLTNGNLDTKYTQRAFVKGE